MSNDRAGDTVRLGLVFSQYDRETHDGALERLVGLLESLRGVQYTLVVVDNQLPGTWFHQVSSRLIHLGGDNTYREFSAFDHGLDFLDSLEQKFDVVGFATDAFRAYGEEFLELIDGQTIRQVLDLEACIGWVDSFDGEVQALDYTYQAWIRTSLFFLPWSFTQQLRPLSFPLEPRELFSESPAEPFKAEAPLSEPLRENLLAWLTTTPTSIRRDEAWHSQFELQPGTLKFFETKVCAILREQLLSARMAAAQLPCFDFRLAKELDKKGLHRELLAEQEFSDWQWNGWRIAKVRRTLEYHLDAFEAPRVLTHGEEKEVILTGWMVADPRVHEVCLRIADLWELNGLCRIPRPDVAAVSSMERLSAQPMDLRSEATLNPCLQVFTR